MVADRTPVQPCLTDQRCLGAAKVVPYVFLDKVAVGIVTSRTITRPDCQQEKEQEQNEQYFL